MLKMALYRCLGLHGNRRFLWFLSVTRVLVGRTDRVGAALGDWSSLQTFHLSAFNVRYVDGVPESGTRFEGEGTQTFGAGLSSFDILGV